MYVVPQQLARLFLAEEEILAAMSSQQLRHTAGDSDDDDDGDDDDDDADADANA